MKNVLVTTFGFLCATALVVSAQDTTSAIPTTNAAPATASVGHSVKHELTAEQKILHKELMEKYDTNKDGLLSKQEVAAMSEEDRVKFRRVYTSFQANLQRPELTAEQKALRKELLEKYDANKNGKLDKEEYDAMYKNKEDLDKAVKAGLIAFQTKLQKLNR